MSEQSINSVDNAENVMHGLQMRILATINRCRNKTRVEYKIIENVIDLKIEIMPEDRRQLKRNSGGKASRVKRRNKRKMEQDHHQQPVQKHSVADDTEQKHQPIERKSISVATGRKRICSPGKMLMYFCLIFRRSNEAPAHLKAAGNSKLFRTGQSQPHTQESQQLLGCAALSRRADIK